MNLFKDQVAVVTGSASGIGRGMATAFARAGMKVVLADIEAGALAETEAAFAADGHDVLAVRTDVSDRDSVFELALAAKARYDKVHILCNNAGVVHGLQAFVPDMIAHGEPGHIVNTSSIVGVWPGDGSIYSVSKHAVTALTEGLARDLQRQQTNIGVSLLLPALTATRINTGARNRPPELAPDDEHPETARFMAQMDARYQRDGMDPLQVGDTVLQAIVDDRFYVFTHPNTQAGIEARMRTMLES
jgi:NAD(P)-dependent dehydrogenase (short-subunit alcohol dehydrogenase family)